MRTTELWDMGTKYVPNFIGVFPLDKMPKYLAAPANFIINTQTHNLPGEHWLAVSYQKGGHVFAFDSFGYYYPLLLQNYLQKLKRTGSVSYNKIPFQDASEDTCGHYCIAYLISINTGKLVVYSSLAAWHLYYSLISRRFNMEMKTFKSRNCASLMQTTH